MAKLLHNPAKQKHKRIVEETAIKIIAVFLFLFVLTSCWPWDIMCPSSFVRYSIALNFLLEGKG